MTPSRDRALPLREAIADFIHARYCGDNPRGSNPAEDYDTAVADDLIEYVLRPAALRTALGDSDGLDALDAEIARRESPDYVRFAKSSHNQPPTERAGQAAVRGIQHGELVGLKLARELLRASGSQEDRQP